MGRATNTARALGTIAALVGAPVTVVFTNSAEVQPGLVVGVVLVLGGLLLRIEAAILERDRLR